MRGRSRPVWWRWRGSRQDRCAGPWKSSGLGDRRGGGLTEGVPAQRTGKQATRPARVAEPDLGAWPTCFRCSTPSYRKPGKQLLWWQPGGGLVCHRVSLFPHPAVSSEATPRQSTVWESLLEAEGVMEAFKHDKLSAGVEASPSGQLEEASSLKAPAGGQGSDWQTCPGRQASQSGEGVGAEVARKDAGSADWWREGWDRDRGLISILGWRLRRKRPAVGGGD